MDTVINSKTLVAPATDYVTAQMVEHIAKAAVSNPARTVSVQQVISGILTHAIEQDQMGKLALGCRIFPSRVTEFLSTVTHAAQLAVNDRGVKEVTVPDTPHLCQAVRERG